MTSQETRVTAAGWYENPADASEVRWWNGIAWTDHTQAKPSAASTERTDASGTRTGSTASVATPAPTTATVPGMLLGVSPLVFLAVAITVISLNLYVVQTPLLWALLLLPYGLCVLWAFQDAKALRARGLAAPAGLWGVAGPLIYLIVRRIAVRGSRHLITFVAIVAAVGIAHVGFWNSGLAAPLEFAIKIQTEIRDDLVGSGEATAVTCPFIAESLAVGSIYSCDATLPDGTHREIVVSIDSNAGDYSYSFR